MMKKKNRESLALFKFTRNVNHTQQGFWGTECQMGGGKESQPA